MKVRAAKKLLQAGLPTLRIRSNINYLDAAVPQWHQTTIFGFAGKALYEFEDSLITADRSQQAALPLLRQLLDELAHEGPLGELKKYGDHVDMNPDVLAGSPVVRGTRLETQLIGQLAHRGIDNEHIATVYSITRQAVTEATDFEMAVA